MIRKGLIFVVCLVLLLFSASAAMAEETETVTTITCELGTKLADYEPLGQILDIAAIRIHSLSDGYGALVLSLDGKDVLTNLVRVDEDGLYVLSDLLGESPHYFSWDDLMAYVESISESNSDIESMSSFMNSDMFEAMVSGSMSDEDYQAQMQEMMGIDDDMLAFINGIQESATVESGSFTLNGSDEANQKTMIALTSDEMQEFLDLPMMRQQLYNQEMVTSSGLTEDEINEAVEADLEEAKEILAESNMVVTVTMYEMDGEFVAMECQLTGLMDNDRGVAESGGFTSIVTKTTMEDASFYQLTVLVNDAGDEFTNQFGTLYVGDDFIAGQYTIYSADGDSILTASINCDLSDPDAVTGELYGTVYEPYATDQSAVLATFDYAKNEDESTDTNLQLYGGESVDAIKASLQDSSIITLHFHTLEQPDSGLFADLQSATPENSVQLTQMNDEEITDYESVLEQNMMMAIYTIIENLPADVSNSLLQSMSD